MLKKLMPACAILVAMNASAVPPIKVDIYSGFTDNTNTSGDGGPEGSGAPYSGLVNSFQAPVMNFGTVTGFNWRPFGLESFGADMKGLLFVEEDGTYTFKWNSDDGAAFLVDGNVLAKRPGLRFPDESTFDLELKEGMHTFEVHYYESYGGPGGFDLSLPKGIQYGFAGMPRTQHCFSRSRKQLLEQYATFGAAASGLGFSDATALRAEIVSFCDG